MKNFIKNNKFTIIAIAIFLVIIILLVQIKNIFFTNGENAIYGDRLNGIEKVEITKSNQDKIQSNLEKESSVKKVSVRVSGKTLEIIITVNDDTSIEDAKNLAQKSIQPCKEEQKKFYDVQVFVKKESDASDFPIIGYKQHSKDNFTFTKDRAVSQ